MGTLRKSWDGPMVIAYCQENVLRLFIKNQMHSEQVFENSPKVVCYGTTDLVWLKVARECAKERWGCLRMVETVWTNDPCPIRAAGTIFGYGLRFSLSLSLPPQPSFSPWTTERVHIPDVSSLCKLPWPNYVSQTSFPCSTHS